MLEATVFQLKILKAGFPKVNIYLALVVEVSFHRVIGLLSLEVVTENKAINIFDFIMLKLLCLVLMSVAHIVYI